jgi:hypothetical protein
MTTDTPSDTDVRFFLTIWLPSRVDAAHRASRRATIGVGAWTALMRADGVARGIDAEVVGAATLLAASCAEGATMVADLVGQHGLTADHVDLARAPWVAAFGACC